MWIKFIVYSVIIVGVILAKLDENSNNDEYIAGVVEYGNGIPNEDDSISSERFVLGNLIKYLYYIRTAKEQNVDILVFPEATFNYFETRKSNIEHGIELPNPDDKIAPHEHPTLFSEILRNISKNCKDNQIYVLVNLVERVRCGREQEENRELCKRNDGFNLYNTNVVFDRFGRIISKYQKFNLFMEFIYGMDTPNNVQYSTFITDFNVKFGHFICFDILFKDPALNLIKMENVTNILYPSMWFSDLPFLTSVQTHSGWAYAQNVNLLSAGANNPSVGCSGSGIYQGRNSFKTKLIAPKNLEGLLITKLPKHPKNVAIKDEQTSYISSEEFNVPTKLQLKLSEQWNEYGVMTWDIDNELQEPQKICAYEDICCTFEVKLKHYEIPLDKISYRYKLVANSTSRKYGAERIGGEMYCAILSCTSQHTKSCGRQFKNYNKYMNSVEFESIKITANIKKTAEFRDALIMPTTLDTNILPIDVDKFDFNKIEDIKENGILYQQYKMESKVKLKNLLTFGIFGRNFAYDQKV